MAAAPRAESASSPGFAPCPGCSLLSSPSPSSTPIKRPSRALSHARAKHGGRHCRSPRPNAELHSPAFLCSSRPLEWNPIALLKLSDPSSPSFPHRSMDAGEQSHRRPPLSADPPPPSTSRRAKTTIRCGVNPSPFSPTFPSPPATLLAGNHSTLPCSVLSSPPRTSLEKKQKF